MMGKSKGKGGGNGGSRGVEPTEGEGDVISLLTPVITM